MANTKTKPKMNAIQKRMSSIFNEWARRYAAEPESFGEILDANGNPVADYGDRCAVYFSKLAEEMELAGQIRPA